MPKSPLNWKKYILYFAQEHVDFRFAEFDSIVKLFQLPCRQISASTKPFWIVEFPDNNAALQFASRSIALRSILELWSYDPTYTDFHSNLKYFIKENKKEVDEYFQSNHSFKIYVETYNKHISQKEKVQKIESLDYLGLEGSVDLRNPDIEYWYIEFWGLDPTAVPENPEDILFGKWLANGQRHLIKELSLKKRKFIGNTSMDAQLSLLMANQALVQHGDFVFDPFVGTGSLLVSAAKFGGYVLGADIDYMMLHARSRPSRITQRVREQDESIRANLHQYGCEKYYLDVVVTDFANSIWRDDLRFDSILTDPPYGIRESVERVDAKQSTKQNMRTKDMPHFPSMSHYALQHLYGDLLIFAAKHLRIGGRLVCWLPFHREDYKTEMIPQHANLNLIANSEQRLTGMASRRLLTYEKHSEPELDQDIESLLIIDENSAEFRKRYFENDIESRSERRCRKAQERERGRLEAIRRGKLPKDSKQLKCSLNKERFD